MGKVEKIFIAGKINEGRIERDTVQAIAGKGLIGDRYFASNRNYKGWQLTLVEKKAIVSFCEKFGITQSLDVLKRNIVTTDIDLNELVGKEFRIGDAICSGIELCFPCMELCKELGKTDKIANEMFLFLKSSGGIRADIIASGKIEIQNRIQEKN